MGCFCPDPAGSGTPEPDDGPVWVAATIDPVRSAGEGENWLALTDEELPLERAHDWAVRPDCGAVVVFSGTVRDHAEGRDDVVSLTYEAYDGQAERCFADIAAQTRTRWQGTGRIAILHRLGTLPVGAASVVVAVSAPHRDEAFAAARFTIDAVKASAPIWKKEHWSGGDAWGTGATDIVEPATLPGGTPVEDGATR